MPGRWYPGTKLDPSLITKEGGKSHTVLGLSYPNMLRARPGDRKGAGPRLLDRLTVLFEALGAPAEPAGRLPPKPLDDPRIVITVAQIMVKRGEAVPFARLLHLGELL